MKDVGKLLGILVLLLAVVGTAMAEVSTKDTAGLKVSVDSPDEAKPNAFNEVDITLENTASYPVSVRAVAVPGHVVLKPSWVDGVDAMKNGNGLTFTAFNVAADSEKEVTITVPGNVIEDVNTESGEISLVKEVKVYPFAGSGAASQGVGTKNLNTMTIDAPTSTAFEEPLEIFFPAIMMGIGFALAFVGAKFLSA